MGHVERPDAVRAAGTEGVLPLPGRRSPRRAHSGTVHPRRARGERRPAPLLAAVAGALLATLFVCGSTGATFIAATSTSADWQTGTLGLTTDHPSTAVFTVAGLLPGDTASRCVNVTYSGSIDASVKLYVQSLSGTGGAGGAGLAQYLRWTVEQGAGAAGGSGGDCTGFTPALTLTRPAPPFSTASLADFAGETSDYTTGVGAWNILGGGSSTRSFRFTYTLDDDQGAQAATAGLTLAWEARQVDHPDLALGATASWAGSACAPSEGAEKAFDGKVLASWVYNNNYKACSNWDNNPHHVLSFDLGSTRRIRDFVVQNAGAGGEGSGADARDFSIDVSTDGLSWSTFGSVAGNAADTTTLTQPLGMDVRYARLTVTNSGDDPYCRIYEVEAYG